MKTNTTNTITKGVNRLENWQRQENEQEKKEKNGQIGKDKSNKKDKFIEAIKRGDITSVERYLKNGVNPNTKEKRTGFYAVEVAIWFGKENIVELLKEYGANMKIAEDFRKKIELGPLFPYF
ncbi:MAG: hypothetical protein QXS91_03150 [Candidatus Anstonellales archaeon]